MKNRLVLTTSLSLCLLLILSACNKVARLELEPKAKTLYSLGGSAKIEPKGFDKGGKPVEGTKVAWATSDEAIVKVSETGEVTAVAAGQATVTAKAGKATAELVVKVVPLASIRVAPESALLVGPAGSTVQFTAALSDDKGIPVDEKVKWSSADPNVATVTPDGLVTSKATGKSSIVASIEGIKGQAPVAVDIRDIARVGVHPEQTILRVNETQNFAATVFDSAGLAIPNPAVNWSSSNKAIAVVDANGQVRAVSKGTCTVDVSFSGKTASSQIIVN